MSICLCISIVAYLQVLIYYSQGVDRIYTVYLYIYMYRYLLGGTKQFRWYYDDENPARTQ